MPRWLNLVTLGAIGLGMAVRPAAARVDIQVYLTSQTMQVSSATGDYTWPISSARSGFHTPQGTFGVKRMETMHHSRKYFNAPMPHSLFFSGGYAIHGTDETRSLGRPASHGCIRIAPENAAALFRMVAAEGGRITIGGSVPETQTRVVVRRERSRAVMVRSYRRWYDGDWPGSDDDGVDMRGYAPVAGQWLGDPDD